MAFVQQHRPQQVRRPSYQQDALPAPALKRNQSADRPQDWVLFAPGSQTNTSHTARTAELSRTSYVGSLETGARSDLLQSDDHILNQITGGVDDDGTELDSLDDGLRDFDRPALPYLDQSGTVLPAHDGLGGFTANNSTEALQDRLWQHERFNPHRRHIHRRLSSVQRRLDALEQTQEVSDVDLQEERRLRVEQWRTEQSKAILDEIERESRRRYRRMSRKRAMNKERSRILAASTSGPSQTPRADHDSNAESVWQQITRKVISDLMGLDDNALSVIFGEDLACESATTPTQPSPLHDSVAAEPQDDISDHTWEERLLDRIARELGTLVTHLAGLGTSLRTTSAPSAAHLSNSTTLFQTALPTSRAHPDPSPLWGIEEEPPLNPDEGTAYWESDPSVLTILSYLRNRFRPSDTGSATPRAPSGPLPAHWAAPSPLGTSPESQRRAELIRRHHPLMSAQPRRSPMSGRDPAATRGPVPELLGAVLALGCRASAGQIQGGSSCASQSARRSRLSGSGTGHSAMYWDWPGRSEGSAVSSGAGRGGWGEV